MELDPILPPAPREIDRRWQPVLKGMNRQRWSVGVAMGLFPVMGFYFMIADSTPEFTRLEPTGRVVTIASLFLLPFAVFGILMWLQRRLLWLIRNGEERPGTLVADRWDWPVRKLDIGIAHGEGEILTSVKYNGKIEQFELFEYQGTSLIRVLVDPNKPTRCQPIPRLDLT